MMTFSGFHEVFINVITNIFHRSFKLIFLHAVNLSPLGSVMYRRERERDVWKSAERVQQAVSFTCICISIFGVHIHVRAAGGRAFACKRGVTSEGITGEFQPSACLNSCLSLHFIHSFIFLSILVLFTAINVCETHRKHAHITDISSSDCTRHAYVCIEIPVLKLALARRKNFP